MVHDDTIVWEPGGTEAETSTGTARRYHKPLKSFRWCLRPVLLLGQFRSLLRQITQQTPAQRPATPSPARKRNILIVIRGISSC